MNLKKFSSFLYICIASLVFTSCGSALTGAMGNRAEKLAVKIPIDGIQFPMGFSKEKSTIYIINNPKGSENLRPLIKGFKNVFDKFYDGSYEYIDQEDLNSISSKRIGYVLGTIQASQGQLTSNTGFREGSQYRCTLYDIANRKTYTTKLTSDYGTITAAYLKKLGSLK